MVRKYRKIKKEKERKLLWYGIRKRTVAKDLTVDVTDQKQYKNHEHKRSMTRK